MPDVSFVGFHDGHKAEGNSMKACFFTAFQPEASPRHSLRVFVGRGYGLCSIELSKGVGNLSKDTSCGEAFVAQC